MENGAGKRVLSAAVTICLLGSFTAVSQAARHQSDGNLFGKFQSYTVESGESLIELARKFDLGFNAIVAANPGVDPWIPSAGCRIDLPTARILPDHQSRPGIVINLPELRLYYFPKEPSNSVVTFPLGIGDQGRDTPLGRYRVVEKTVKPVWHVPSSIRSESPGLPRVVPPGPDNPLGSRAMRLSRHDLLIHGTNRPWGIGRKSSHGCLRLYPEDIVKLFKMVRLGTSVTVIDQPLKACVHGGKIFLEVHRSASGEVGVGRALHLLADKNLLTRTDFAKVIQAVAEMKGMPMDITLYP
jgi:L,D-transpeptidase ErfK/SrfK